MTTGKDISFILKALPHRYPFLLVDRVLDYTADKAITALKNITVSEPYFPGHFPDHPVMPGVLQVEALAQASGLLLLLSAGVEQLPEGHYIYFAGMDEVRFRRPVVPGDRLILSAELTRKVRHISRFTARATVDEQTACEAVLTIAYTQDAPAASSASTSA